MNIAIIGTGSVGRTLGARWAQLGHAVVFGTRRPEDRQIQQLAQEIGSGVRVLGIQEAIEAAEVVVLATPWRAAQELAASRPDWGGRVLIDCTNPILPGMQLAFGPTTSAAEEMAKKAQGARVVKAFNTTGQENMQNPVYQDQPTTMFICGDDSEARKIVQMLAEDLGFEVADTGALQTARFLEPLAMVWITLARTGPWRRQFAFRLVHR